ncbi:4'-phosphopantetheinyl transferase family protein [Scopulibacillus cellulosilyticus]|uniref:4'-phosphopantetheinyl transferase family protein n=1 Tax=Scopulibacillus cellulosilyticus TaxID=2665665 RepID=A0ABW2PY49_9BACL
MSKEKKKILQYKNKNIRSLQCIVSDLLTRAMVYKHVGVKYREQIYGKNEYGKPFLVKGGLQFNISHSHEYLILALSKKGEIGVDIEKVKPVKKTLLDYFLQPREYHSITSLSNPKNQLDLTFSYWTLKESFVKALGKGLTLPLKSFSIDLDKLFIIKDSYTYYFKLYNFLSSYKIAVCSTEKEFPNKINYITPSELNFLLYKLIS